MQLLLVICKDFRVSSSDLVRELTFLVLLLWRSLLKLALYLVQVAVFCCGR